MAGVANLDFDLLAESLERVLKLVYVVRGDAEILAAEQAEDRSVDFLQRLGIGSEMAVVDDVGSEIGSLTATSSE